MGRPYSDDLRERVLKEAERSSARRAAVRFGISAATAVRWAARAERTIDALWRAVGEIVPAFTLAECAKCFQAAGYDAT